MRVHRLQDPCDAESIGRVAAAQRPRPHELGSERSIQCSGRAFARHVTDGHDERVLRRHEKVVQVSSKFTRGLEAAGHLGVTQRGQIGRHQRELDALRESQLLVDPLFSTPDFLVEPRVLDGHRRLAREQRQQLRVLLREGVELGALEVEHADAAILDQHRNDQFGSGVRDEVEVAGILRHVGDEHRLLVQRRPSDETFARA